MKRKVLIAITKSNWGGAQRYVLDLSKALVEKEYAVVVVCGGNGHLVALLKENNVRVVTIPSLERDVSAFTDVKTLMALLGIIRRERPNIVHLNSSKMGGLGALAARVLFVPRIIFTAHGWEFNAPRPRWQKIIIRLFAVYTVLLAHQTIAVSTALKKDLRILQHKIVVIHNGIDEPDFLDREAARTAIAAHAHISADAMSVWFGTIAELHPVKGLAYAIEAFADVARLDPHARYICIGEGSERAHLQNIIHQHGLEHRVHLVGFVEDAARFLKAFDVFVLPSRSEGLAYVILEAGLAALPVIASNVGGIPEIISSHNLGVLVAVGDTKSMTVAMNDLVGSDALRSRLGATLHARVRDDFSLSRMIDATIAVYG